MSWELFDQNPLAPLLVERLYDTLEFISECTSVYFCTIDELITERNGAFELFALEQRFVEARALCCLHERFQHRIH